MKRPERLSDALALCVLLCVTVIACLTFRDYGLGWDDYTHAQYGELLLKYYESGFTDKRALSFVNLYMYGGGFDMAAALLDRLTPFDLFATRRLLGALVGIVGLFVTWRLTRRIGGPLAGFFAVALLATCPLYYGHMFINPKDSPFAVAMVILLYGLVRLLEEFPRPRLATITVFGLGLGLSFGSRILAGIAAPYVVAPLTMLFVDDVRNNGFRRACVAFTRFMAMLIPAVLIAYAVMAVIWPWSVVEPLNPFRAVAYFSHFFEKPWSEMYEGALISVPDMPRSYVPVNFLLKTPELLLLLTACGIVATIIAAIRSTLPLKRRAVLVLLLGAATIPILVAVAVRPAMYNGIRHFVFVAPALAIVGGLAGGWIFSNAQRISRAATAAFVIVVCAGLADPVADMVRLHPYQYTHFNHIAGGIEEADDKFMLDYWGLAFKEAAQRLRELLTERVETPPRGHWRIAICGPHPPAQVELGPEFVATWDPKGADFALMLGAFYCAELDAPVLVEVSRENVIFARVYDIRGRTIRDLFTIPPVR